jgi:arylsulfatase A-like enzyme/Tfp pilus assembly protein PilF
MPRLPLLLVSLFVAEGAAAERPSVVLVTLDTTRADRMGFLGAKAGLTPALDRLAAQGTVFERAFAQAPITTVSHATILSGTYPQLHKVNDFGVPLPATLPWLPELLHGAGYRTAAFVGSLILDPRNGLAPGFDRGFDTYDAGFRVRRGKDDRYQTMERRGAEVVARAVRWLNEGPPGPFLLWVHLYDAHDPYDPPPPYAARAPGRPYDGEIAYLDDVVGRLVDGLRGKGVLDDTLVAVFGDHGESLGEHGEKTHGVFLYDSTLHVPLLLKLPKGRAAGRRVSSRVSLVDLMPSVLEVAGLPVPPAVQGESLLRLLDAPRPADRASYAETDYPRRAFGWSSLSSWRVERFLFVNAPRRELYDLPSDAQAAHNLAGERESLADRIAAELQEFRRRTSGEGGDAASANKLDPALVERLAALGYAAGASAAAAPRSSGIDPKDKVAVANSLHDAMAAVESGDFLRAGPLLEQVTATDPQIYVAQLQLGVARARQRQYATAIPPLRRAIELQPDSAVAHHEMGLALYETGDWKTAAGHFEIVVQRMPKFADAHFSLGSIYARIDRVEDATRELRIALDLEPRHYRANLLMGRLLDLQGRSAEGVPFLEQAVAANADSYEAHAFLADAYERVGRASDAARMRARAAGLKPPSR